MKNKGKMRILALVLCMVVMLSNSSFIFASGETEAAAAAPETTAVTPESEVSAASELAELPTPEPTAEPTPEASAAPKPTEVPTPEASAAPEPTEVPPPEASAAPEPPAEPTPEASAAPEPTEVPTPEVSAVPEPTEIPTSEPTPEASASPTPAAEQDIGSEESAAVTPTPEAEPEPDGSSEEIVLEGNCGDTTVILSGPASSFPEGTELSILVQEPAEEDQEVIEEAVEKQAEEQEMEVKSYTALDIRLLSNGEEIQPLGPVSVKFQQPEQQERTAEETSTQVLHVDESTGDATDMEAEVTEDGEVAIETTHFSIYVVVDLEELGGQVDLTVQHWAHVKKLINAEGAGNVGLTTPASDNSGADFNTRASLSYEKVFTSIYSDDVLTLDNTFRITAEKLSKIYESNQGKTNENYTLTDVWVLKEGKDSNTSDETNESWNKYTINTSKDQDITLREDSVIRFIYEPKEYEDSLSNDVTFYDWNVTEDGKQNGQDPVYSNGIPYTETYWTDQGVNDVHDPNNYTGGSQGGKNQFAVGQSTGGVWHYRDLAQGGTSAGGGTTKYLNKGNGSGSYVENIVSRVEDSGRGKLVFSDGIFDANLFVDNVEYDNSAHNGKYVTDGYTLQFNQYGDTYTLSSVKDGNGSKTQDNLEVIWETYDQNGTNLFSNNFWPLDSLRYSNQDPLWGNGKQAGMSGGGLYGYYNEKVTWNKKDYVYHEGAFDKSVPQEAAIATSDDGKAHNWYFGMRYDFEFSIGDYTGPLNFYFRGDDDFWLFIDGELKVDIGGIHSSIGKFFDMEYLREPGQDLDKTHHITIIYAERGGAGSCCYMEFTLPNVTPLDVDTTVEKTAVTVEKEWIDHNNPNRPTEIQVQLLYKGPNDKDYKEEGEPVTLSVANNWQYTWRGLPKKDYKYKVVEVDVPDHYKVIYPNGGDGVYLPTDDGSYEGEFTNKADPSTWITVTKQWDDGELESQARPEKVDFYLYYRKTKSTEWLPYPTNGRLSLTAKNAEKNSDDIWQGVYEDLPVYDADGEKLEYTVKEVNGDTELAEGATLPGKDSYKYTVQYRSVDHYKNGTWKAYTAKENEETLHLIVENSLGMEIRVTKEWKGHAPAENAVVYAGLYKHQQPVKDKWVKLESDNWTASFEYLTPATDYSVKELRQVKDEASAEFTIGGTGYVGVNSGEETTVGDGDSAIKYVVSYSQLTKDVSDENLSTITITNQAQWQLIKYSSSSTDKSYTLQGAKFELEDSEGRVYTGESDQNGVVQWENNPFTDGFPDDIYTLTETAAPTGYALGDSVTFEMKDGVPVKMNGENAIIKDGILTFYYANEAIYSLPSSGSNGIYGYLSSGTLLLMAGTLILYKMKRKEVQES